MSTDAGGPITESELHQVIDTRSPGYPQFLILAVCFLLQTMDGYDVLAMSFAAPTLAEDWTLSADRLGMVFSAGMLGMTLGAMLLAPLTDRIGRRTVILWAVLVMGISMLATAWVESLPAMVIMRVLTGLTIGVMLASLTSLVSEFFPDRLRNMAIGILLAGYPLGAVLGGLLASALIPAYGWQGVFVAGGIMTLCLLPLVLLYVPESLHFLMRRRPDSTLERMNEVLRYLQMSELRQVPSAGAAPEAASVFSLLTKSRRKSTVQLWTSFFLCFGTLYFLLSWIPKLLVDSGLPLGQAISAGIAINIGGVIGNICIGWVSTRLGLQKTILYFHLVAATGMLLFAWLPLGIASLLWLAGIIGLFQQGGFVGFYMTAARLYPAEIRTTGVGWGIGLGRFGAVIAPYLAGQLIAAGWDMSTLFSLFAIPLAIGGWITYSIRSKDLPR